MTKCQLGKVTTPDVARLIFVTHPPALPGDLGGCAWAQPGKLLRRDRPWEKTEKTARL